MKKTTYINPQTGGYMIEDNQLIKVSSVVNKANRLLLQPYGSDIYNPTIGNPILSATGVLSPSEIAAGINNCLAPLLNTGEISQVIIAKITVTPLKKNLIDIVLVLPDGTSEPLQWSR